jgi:hypothetical protein
MMRNTQLSPAKDPGRAGNRYSVTAQPALALNDFNQTIHDARRHWRVVARDGNADSVVGDRSHGAAAGGYPPAGNEAAWRRSTGMPSG